MLDDALFEKSIKFNDFTKRNISYMNRSTDIFASISKNQDDLNAIDQITEIARLAASDKEELSDFYYTSAVGYPFETKPYMQTRYSDGSYPVWYGSDSVKTSIYETVYHTVRYVFSEEGTKEEEKIVKKRSVFNVMCNAILIDLRGKQGDFPDIVSDDYLFTHEIGKAMAEHELSGLISPSKRLKEGHNFSIFKQSVLHDPELLGHLRYEILPKAGIVKVTGMNHTMDVAIPI